MPTNIIPIAELTVDILLAIIQNPNTDPKDGDLADIAIAHTTKLIKSLEEQHDHKH